MLTIRPFHNADPPRLVELQRKYQQYKRQDIFSSLSINQLQAQVLGLPMTDLRSIMLALDDDKLVGYIHTALSPDADGSRLDNTTGQICMLCADPGYPNQSEVLTSLIRAGESYLVDYGVQEIFGGSPTPAMPFYTGFYGGGEVIGFLQTDEVLVRGFLETGYRIDQKTTWFHLDMNKYEPLSSTDALAWLHTVTIEINDAPRAKSWYEGCILINGNWLEAMAFFNATGKPIARIRVRIACPNSDEPFVLYNGLWTASLIDIRVHPDFRHQGVGKFLLSELVRHLADRRQITQIDAHIAEDSLALYALLSGLYWEQREQGYIFYKHIR
jgi:ribosomal protein S18 acetylase RimI-like enzyme